MGGARALSAATSLTTVGPKLTGYAELPLDLLRSAALVVSDSPAQLAELGAPYRQDVVVTHLGALIGGEVAPPEDGLRVFCSAGPAGSEVVLAECLLSTVD